MPLKTIPARKPAALSAQEAVDLALEDFASIGLNDALLSKVAAGQKR